MDWSTKWVDRINHIIEQWFEATSTCWCVTYQCKRLFATLLHMSDQFSNMLNTHPHNFSYGITETDCIH